MNVHFNPNRKKVYSLPAIDSWPESRHRFDERSVWAIRAALAARRPLLVRGEPGLGKSQLARAAAHVLEVPFLCQVINARSECNDLLYAYDAVSRLAQAQVMGTSGQAADWADKLDEARFVQPGILWWAFDWNSGRTQAARFCRAVREPSQPKSWKPGRGCVVLIDEIDKADADLPNGLLESLGNTGFQAAQAGCTVALPEGDEPPLVVVTTNEERELPAAFLRRCLVLQMKFPETEAEQIDFLLDRGRVHHHAAAVGDAVCREAARQLLKDRTEAQRFGHVRPGPAEYLDLLGALVNLHEGKEAEQMNALAQIRDFALRKNPEETRS